MDSSAPKLTLRIRLPLKDDHEASQDVLEAKEEDMTTVEGDGEPFVPGEDHLQHENGNGSISASGDSDSCTVSDPLHDYAPASSSNSVSHIRRDVEPPTLAAAIPTSSSKIKVVLPKPAVVSHRTSLPRAASSRSSIPYSDEFVTGEELDNLEKSENLAFKLGDILARTYFDATHVVKKFSSGMELSFEQEVWTDGFRSPMLVERATGLGLMVPSSSKVDVDYIAERVGYDREFEVIDVASHKEERWPMYKWVEYFSSPLSSRGRKRNVISLEVSDSPLSKEIQAPRIVRAVDWIDHAWPASWKQQTLRHTRIGPEVPPSEWKFPKVQKYVLMSVAGCYTDFHVDFGGSSVWYHVSRGRKIFFLIPPTAENLSRYTRWASSPDQSSTFFADKVDHCFRLQVEAGNTLFIPSGWIHSVYTPDDSIIFGGNFLHSYSAFMQLRISAIEEATSVPIKYQVPFYQALLWHAVELFRLRALSTSVDSVKEHKGLSLWEICGGLALVKHLRESQPSRRTYEHLLPSDVPGVLEKAEIQLIDVWKRVYAQKSFPSHDYSQTLEGKAIDELIPKEKVVIKLSMSSKGSPRTVSGAVKSTRPSPSTSSRKRPLPPPPPANGAPPRTMVARDGHRDEDDDYIPVIDGGAEDDEYRPPGRGATRTHKQGRKRSYAPSPSSQRTNTPNNRQTKRTKMNKQPKKHTPPSRKREKKAPQSSVRSRLMSKMAQMSRRKGW